MLPFLRESFGNPGTPHPLVGGVVQRAVRGAREAVAELISCRANELIWTSGATEANNLAILGFAEGIPPGRRHLITQVTEHSAVLEPCRFLEKRGWNVTYLPIDEFGQINIGELTGAIDDGTSMVSVMWGNNEIGTLQPVEEIAAICANRGIVFHCDAAQAVGKVPINLEDVPISMLTLSAHKFYGPKGVGVLFVRDLNKSRALSPRVLGGGQEKGLRAGTLNVPGVVGMGAACILAVEHLADWYEYVRMLRDRFESIIFATLDDLTLNGPIEHRLPHISNIAFFGTDSEGLLTLLPEVVASNGSACHVTDFAPSHVLDALPLTRPTTGCSIRFGFGKGNTEGDIKEATQLVCNAVVRLREE